jgi:hypothetical protein
MRLSICDPSWVDEENLEAWGVHSCVSQARICVGGRGGQKSNNDGSIVSAVEISCGLQPGVGKVLLTSNLWAMSI